MVVRSHLYPTVSNTAWSETGITWNNKGTHGTTAYAQTGKRPYNTECIYGEDRLDLEEPKICDGCKKQIQIYNCK